MLCRTAAHGAAIGVRWSAGLTAASRHHGIEKIRNDAFHHPLFAADSSHLPSALERSKPEIGRPLFPKV
jgi:hypothetical protein